ncbi:MAG: disulfide bond formation protein B, partial [Pseudobdellovibrionaceae bacterium]
AIYHNLLYYGIIPDSITPCTQGISCTSKQVEYLGFITIPLLSLMSFIGLVVLGFLILRNREKKKYE